MRARLFLVIGMIGFRAAAHPGSGIVVDSQGQVFFQDSVARTIWKIDASGKVTSYYDKLGGHWMALDRAGAFARADLKLVERITPAGVVPALIVADGGAPVAVNSGNLYYGLDVMGAAGVAVGLTKVFPDGKKERFAPELARAIEKLGITGIASGPDGALYLACLTRVIKVTTNGSFKTVVDGVEVHDCDRDAVTAFLRGLDVESDGSIYAAACGCRCVVKISPAGNTDTFLKSERPWSPTGVAVQGGNVYVLEYTNPNGSQAEGWRPRVRRVGRDGKVTALVTISEEQQKRQPHWQSP
jgi:hypothetical protein